MDGDVGDDVVALLLPLILDLVVTLPNRPPRAVRDFVPFTIDPSAPSQCILNVLRNADGPETRFSIARTGEQFGKSYLMAILDYALRIKSANKESILILCDEVKATAASVAAKMGEFVSAIRQALDDADVISDDFKDILSGHLPTFLPCDGRASTWARLDSGPVSDTLVVPASYTIALGKVADYLFRLQQGCSPAELLQRRPVVCLDEADRTHEHAVDFTDMERAPIKMVEVVNIMAGSREVVAVTATPGAVMAQFWLNDVYVRAYLGDLERMRLLGFETGDNVVLHPSCRRKLKRSIDIVACEKQSAKSGDAYEAPPARQLEEKDFGPASGFMEESLHCFIAETFPLSMQPGVRNLLVYMAMNNSHRHNVRWGNADTAVTIVDGNPNPRHLNKKHTMPVLPALCPNAIVVVKTASEVAVRARLWPADVAHAVGHFHATEGAAGFDTMFDVQYQGGFYSTWVVFRARGGKDAYEWATSWITTIADQEHRPMFVECYLFRSFTARHGERVVTGAIVHPKNAQGVAAVRQASARGAGDGVVQQRLNNGMPAIIMYMLPTDFDACVAYPYLWDAALAPAINEPRRVRELVSECEVNGLPVQCKALFACPRKLVPKSYGDTLRDSMCAAPWLGDEFAGDPLRATREATALEYEQMVVQLCADMEERIVASDSNDTAGDSVMDEDMDEDMDEAEGSAPQDRVASAADRVDEGLPTYIRRVISDMWEKKGIREFSNPQLVENMDAYHAAKFQRGRAWSLKRVADEHLIMRKVGSVRMYRLKNPAQFLRAEGAIA